ncbi:hypothetical protein E4U51_005884 [Claviceps purpurea]|nr:hypothetical protein E4U51_005884 [Claviceps purpurea]
MSSLQSDDDTLRNWIDPGTEKLKFSRLHEYNLEERTVAGADLFRIRYYKTMTEDSKALRFKVINLSERTAVITRLYQQKKKPRSRRGHIGGQLRVTTHHIKGQALVQHANAIFAARRDCQPDKQA